VSRHGSMVKHLKLKGDGGGKGGEMAQVGMAVW
jgi:hypothetical protein